MCEKLFYMFFNNIPSIVIVVNNQNKI